MGKEIKKKKITKDKSRREQYALNKMFKDLRRPPGGIFTKEWLLYVWEKFFVWFKNTSKFNLFVSAILLILVSMMFSVYHDNKYPKENKKFEYDGSFGTVRKMQQLKKSHTYYSNITPEEIYHKWTDMFYDVSYRKNGSLKFDQADCVAAVHTWLQYYGYQRKIENVQGFDTTITKLNAAGFQKIRKSLREVSPGDIIIFNPRAVGSWHIGIVVRTVPQRNQVIYADMNGLGGMGFREVAWNSPGQWGKIRTIAEVSYPFFAGDVWEEYTKDPSMLIEKPEEGRLEKKPITFKNITP